jgi:hypothetical protein
VPDFPTALAAAEALVAALKAHQADPNDATHERVIEIGGDIEGYIFSTRVPWSLPQLRPDAAAEVVAAWTVVGANPAFHREAQARLHAEWPMLARAVERLVQSGTA